MSLSKKFFAGPLFLSPGLSREVFAGPLFLRPGLSREVFAGPLFLGLPNEILCRNARLPGPAERISAQSL